MARKPRDQYRSFVFALLMFSVLLTGLSGCEVGRTMFQYSSGSSSPWVGIDLLPRKKKKTTKISHRKKVASSSRQSERKQVVLEKEPVTARFGKKPIRLDLPPSKPLRNGDDSPEPEEKIEPLSPARSFDF